MTKYMPFRARAELSGISLKRNSRYAAWQVNLVEWSRPSDIYKDLTVANFTPPWIPWPDSCEYTLNAELNEMGRVLLVCIRFYDCKIAIEFD